MSPDASWVEPLSGGWLYQVYQEGIPGADPMAVGVAFDNICFAGFLKRGPVFRGTRTVLKGPYFEKGLDAAKRIERCVAMGEYPS